MNDQQQAIAAAIDLCVNSGLYALKSFEKSSEATVDQVLKWGSFQFDCYCVACKKESTFKVARDINSYDYAVNFARKAEVIGIDTVTVIAECQRVNDHHYEYFFLLTDTGVRKIGQIPSLEDIAASDIQKYRPVLDNSYFSELHRAGGLFSHGIGIGAFVYLRRIFERLVEQHYQEYRASGDEIEGFATLRMEEKVKVLAGILPAPLVENWKAYSILSKGLHELDEETCRRHFPVLKAAIISILEEDLQARKKARAAKALREAIAAAAGEVTSDAAMPIRTAARPQILVGRREAKESEGESCCCSSF